jgi:hypothetical protein
MSEVFKAVCPECNETVERSTNLDRRDFLRNVGAGTATLAVTVAMPDLVPSPSGTAMAMAQTPAPAAAANAGQAESLVRELCATLTADQRSQIVKPWDHRSSGGLLTRHRMVNAPISRRIGDVYTRPQQELLQRIVRSLCSDDTGYDRICRRENAQTAWDNSRSFDGCGADIFGEVADGREWAWVFSGHHITIRCNGDSEPNRAFGGPIYYGHTPDGYSQRNVFYHQTRAVLSVFDALTEQQRNQAIVVGTPGELEPSIRFRPSNDPVPGIAAADLSHSQRLLIHSVMREVISPFRQQDGDKVMDIVNRQGGLDRVHLAFYRDRMATDANRWHFWRLEGPGFVWNYRVLPHVHTYVNVALPQRA